LASAPDTSSGLAATRRLRVVVHGAVQGVGFRPFVYRLATELRLPGWVINSAQGVFIEVEGEDRVLREFLLRLEGEKPAISFIQSLESWFLDPAGFERFEIRESSGGEKTALILPDLATCPDCLREVNDPADRRYRYPFTNCTNCGPRFTIIESLPYDRPRTTMRKFTLCAECEREYHDPADRRFHAQPNACPACGPHLELWDRKGALISSRHEALRDAAEAVREAQIVAVKGLGGFHLICDARDEDAVRELRRRKRREEKPFALMYPSFERVLEDCECTEIERRLLRSPESSIVLLRRRGDAGRLSGSVAPGNPWIGAMLPYTPLHHLLMQELGFPVIATSGNLSEEPICTDEQEALERLRGIADLFLVHGRPILRHVDDSIVREMAGRELVLRRARGFAPLPVQIEDEAPAIVAVGPHQKNTIAASVGTQVFISQHIGDLETAESLRAFERVNTAFRELYELRPEAVACDMHPDYLSTQYAARQPETRVPVQHHYAHALACMAENRIRPPLLAVTWDGSGFGPDGTVWGGEFLRVTGGGYERVAHLRTFPLPGGEKAVKQPRRVALALLHEIFGDEAFALDLPPVRAFTCEELRVLRAMLKQRINSPLTSSAGRLFDAVAALAGLRQICGFEGQAAMELEFAADASRRSVCEPYPFSLQGENPIVIDWEPMLREIVAAGEDLGVTALRFHVTLAAMAAAVARRIGEPKIVLSGGCFQNRLLTELVIRHIQEAGLQPYWHQRVPPNDGGIALGQIAGAARQLTREANHVPGSPGKDSQH
jgi:hydrogenase maturation protein HypF